MSTFISPGGALSEQPTRRAKIVSYGPPEIEQAARPHCTARGVFHSVADRRA